MKPFSILLLFIVLTSCKEKTSYNMQILLKNNTDGELTVQLFPRSDYQINNREDLYKYSDLGNGDYKDKFFEVEPDEAKTLFITADLNQEPYDLVLKIVDSIYVVSSDEEIAAMRFYPDSVIGYTENIFAANCTWDYEKRNYDEPDSFNQNPGESHNFTFIISTINCISE